MEQLKREIESAIEGSFFVENFTGRVMKARDFEQKFLEVKDNEFGKLYNQYSNWKLGSGHIKSNLIDQIRSEFSQFICDDDRGHSYIGASYYYADKEPRIIYILNFLTDIVRASIVEGTENVINELEKWKSPEQKMPMKLKCKISGIYVNESIEFINNSRIISTKFHSCEEIRNQSVFIDYHFSDSLKGKYIEDLNTLEIGFDIHPALFHPNKIEEVEDNQEKN